MDKNKMEKIKQKGAKLGIKMNAIYFEDKKVIQQI